MAKVGSLTLEIKIKDNGSYEKLVNAIQKLCDLVPEWNQYELERSKSEIADAIEGMVGIS